MEFLYFLGVLGMIGFGVAIWGLWYQRKLNREEQNTTDCHADDENDDNVIKILLTIKIE